VLFNRFISVVMLQTIVILQLQLWIGCRSAHGHYLVSQLWPSNLCCCMSAPPRFKGCPFTCAKSFDGLIV
jgi:hypothetical protein